MPTNLSLAEGIIIKVFAFCDFHFQRDVFSDIKTISVEQKYCEYYVEGNHEAIIRKDVFMRVQSEIARHANLNPDGKRSDLQERMNDMISFLDELPEALTEYSDAITRRLVERITIYDDKIVVELKSGLRMEVDA